jgi:hypothetical protein
MKMLFCGTVGFFSYYIGFFLFLYFYVGKQSSEWGDVFLANWVLYSLILGVISALILGIPYGLASIKFYSFGWLNVLLLAILIGIISGIVISALILSNAFINRQNLTGCAIITGVLVLCNIITIVFIKSFLSEKIQ